MTLADRVVFRREDIADRAAVRAVNEAAFGRDDEASLVERLHAGGAVLVSRVAEVDSRIVGHILFSRMWIDTAAASMTAVALAPMAVLPAHQRQGIGGRLIRDGLDCIRAQGEQVVIVLGHPDYYARFGFSSDRARALSSPFPPEAFMALELTPGALDDVNGTVRYPRAFELHGTVR